jgi:hypothetical protein
VFVRSSANASGSNESTALPRQHVVAWKLDRLHSGADVNWTNSLPGCIGKGLISKKPWL